MRAKFKGSFALLLLLFTPSLLTEYGCSHMSSRNLSKQGVHTSPSTPTARVLRVLSPGNNSHGNSITTAEKKKKAQVCQGLPKLKQLAYLKLRETKLICYIRSQDIVTPTRGFEVNVPLNP